MCRLVCFPHHQNHHHYSYQLLLGLKRYHDVNKDMFLNIYIYIYVDTMIWLMYAESL